MPNGGSDCCGSCWFNLRNKGEAGYDHSDDPEPNHCTIRDLEIPNPFWTYCANHPHRRPVKDPVPIGPVLVADDLNYGERKVWVPSPDTPEVRAHLLDLVARIREQPSAEYPIGGNLDEVVVWELGQLRETRAVPDLLRVAALSPEAADAFGRTREALVAAAREALKKIGEVEA